MIKNVDRITAKINELEDLAKQFEESYKILVGNCNLLRQYVGFEVSVAFAGDQPSTYHKQWT